MNKTACAIMFALFIVSVFDQRRTQSSQIPLVSQLSIFQIQRSAIQNSDCFTELIQSQGTTSECNQRKYFAKRQRRQDGAHLAHLGENRTLTIPSLAEMLQTA